MRSCSIPTASPTPGVRASVNDIRDPLTDTFGVERFQKTFLIYGERSPEKIKNGILGKQGEYQFNDDITMIVVKRL
jgi:serine phosphatase RsbU (regulator of sigma subunit)